MTDRRRTPAMRGSCSFCLALLCLGSSMYITVRGQQDKTLPELPQVGNLPHLPAVNVKSFAGSAVQPVLEALPNVAPTPSVKELEYAAAHDAVLEATATSEAAKNALAPKVAEVRAVEGPVQALAHAVTTVASEYGSELGLGPSAQPPALGPRPAALRNIIITGENDNTVEAEAEAQAEAPEGPPELPQLPQPAPLPQVPVQAPAPAPVASATASLTSRPTDALHSAGVTSFVAQQPQQPAQPKTELISNSDGTQTVIVKMPSVPDPTSLQALPQLPSGQNRHLLEQYAAPAPAPGAMSPARGLPSLPAVPALGLPNMPEIELPATAEGLLTPMPAPKPQGPAAAAAYEATQPYSAFYKLLPVLSGTGVGRKLQQGGPQQQPGPQQPAAGQAQPQSFQQQQQQQPAAGQKTVAPLTIHPDLTLDQNTKILTVNQGQATIFGQTYTLPALPFKLPATPALNSLQTLYPNMDLGDAPLNTAPAGAPGYAPAPQSVIDAAIAAEEAPTPQEKAVANPVTNVLSALLAGRRRLQQQQPGPEHPAPQQPAAGQAQPQSFQQQQQQPAAGQKTVAPLTIHPDLTLDQNTKILTVNQGQATIFGQTYTLPALPFKLPATPALNSLQTLYPNMDLGDAPLNTAPAGAPGYAPAPQSVIDAAIAAEEAPTPQEKAVANPVTNVLSALLAGRKLQQTDFEEINSHPVSVKEAGQVANQAIYQSLEEAQQIFNPPAAAPAAYAPAPSEGQRGLPALPSVPDIGLSGMPAIALPENPGELWAPLPAPNENNIFATRPAEAVKPYSSFYRALPTVTDSAIKPEAGRKLAQIQPNDPSKPAQPFGYRNPKPLIQLQPKVLVDQKNRKAFATGGDILLANGETIPLPGGFALPTTGLWSGLLDIPQGAVVDGPVPAPDLAPSVPAQHAAMAPAHAAPATNPISFLVDALTSIGNAAEARANAASGTAGRKLAQLQANDPNKPAQPFGYRNPKPLIQVQPKMIIDQKNRKAFATGGDILLANGQTIPLPGGFALPTTGLWSGLLDIPAGTQVEGPIPAPDLAPALPSRKAPSMAPAMAPAPSMASAAAEANPLVSLLVNGITNIGNAIESRADTGSGRRLQQSEEVVQGLTLSVALLGETRETFAPKQEAFVRELEQGMGLQAGAVSIVKAQMQKARYAENVLRLGRHLMADSQTKEQADLVVTFTVDTATPQDTLAALEGALGSGGKLTSVLQGRARVHMLPESLRKVPPASDA